MDDNYEEYKGLYEDGHWEWCDDTDALVFKSHKIMPQNSSIIPPSVTQIGSMDFKSDLDLIEQQRFRKHFQRKISDDDVITLQVAKVKASDINDLLMKILLRQDIRDLVLFTAPKSILTATIIRMLHFPSMDRYLRALISYCQYYLQTADCMDNRIEELNFKVRTPKTDEIEQVFRENLEDLRLLVAKEYCSMIIGAEEYSRYHHMGHSRNKESLLKRDAIQFETLLRIGIQIVWLALGRKSYNQIELEIHRLYKSDVYNIAEHKLKTKYLENLGTTQRLILLGSCVKRKHMLNSDSPLIDETSCRRDYDYQLMGLGQINYEQLDSRLRYFERLLITPEPMLSFMGMSIGIIGLPRSQFDTMLKKIQIPSESTTSIKLSSRKSLSSRSSRISPVSRKSIISTSPQKEYEDMYIPDKREKALCIPDHFPSEMQRPMSCNREQRKKWLSYVGRLNKK